MIVLSRVFPIGDVMHLGALRYAIAGRYKPSHGARESEIGDILGMSAVFLPYDAPARCSKRFARDSLEHVDGWDGDSVKCAGS